MTLGIPNNKWHFILTVVAVALVFFIFWYFLSDIFISAFGIAATAIIGFVFAVQIAHHLQCWNEIKQALDPKVEKEYGNLKGFQENSKDDFKWFWRGISVSWIAPLAISFLL